MLIVFATMVVEVAFDVEQTTPELEAATYIVIFRLWRLPHTCNSRYMYITVGICIYSAL